MSEYAPFLECHLRLLLGFSHGYMSSMGACRLTAAAIPDAEAHLHFVSLLTGYFVD